MSGLIQINVLSSLACKDRIDTIKNSWGRYFSDIFFYADFEFPPDIIKCTDIATSIGNEQKLLNRLIQVKQNNVWDWYFFIDDDTFVNSINLFDFLNNADKNKAYGRIVGGWGIVYFQGGGGTLISNKLISAIPDSALYLRGSTYSDVLFGQIMKDSDIELVHIEEFYDRSPQSYNLNTEQIKKAITFHQVANTMLDLYQEIY